MMSKLNIRELFRTSPEGTCLLSGRHPARRWHDLHTGFSKELGNLSFRYQGELSSEASQEIISDAKHRGGLTRSSDETAVMVVERRGQVIQSKALVNFKQGRN